MRLAEISVRRPVLMTTFLLMLVLSGIYSYTFLNLDTVPKVDIPIVTVLTIYPGAGPEEVENLVSRVVEDAVSSVSGIDYMKSESQENVSAVIISFLDGVDVDVAANDVRDKVSAIQYKLPDEVEQPQILKLDINALPVITLGIMSDSLSVGELTEYTDRYLKDRFANVKGVAQVDILGGRKREIQLLVRDETLKKYGISLAWLYQSLMSASIDIPGGHITQNQYEFSVKFSGEADRVEDFKTIKLTLPGGSEIKLDELVEVKDTFEEIRQMSRFNGKDSLFLVIKKRSDANAVETVQNIRKAVKEFTVDLPAGTKFQEARDTAEFTQSSLDDLFSNMGIGILLTAGVLFLFLKNWQGMVISALAIPVSVIATFSFFVMLDFTLNMMSLMALAISVGILVNNAIIVMENIIARINRGEEPDEAAIRGTGEIFIAVTGATMTNVVVFTPIAFMDGIIGKFFMQFGLTAAIATLVSLIVSFTMTPMMAAWLLKRRADNAVSQGVLSKLLDGFERFYMGLRDDYIVILTRSMKRPWFVLILAVVCFFGSFLFAGYIGFEFITNSDQSAFNVMVRMPSGTSLQQTDQAIRRIEEIVSKVPELSHSYAKIGKTENIVGGSSEAINIGEITLCLVPPSERELSERQIGEKLLKSLAVIPEATVTISYYGIMGAEEAPLQVEVKGPEMAKLEELSKETMKRIKNISGTVDIDTTYISGKPELRVYPNRLKIRDAGLTEQLVGIELRARYEGLVPIKFRDGSREYDVRIKLEQQERNNTQQLENSDFISLTGQVFPLRDLGKIEEVKLPSKITRKDRQRMIAVVGRTEGRSYGEVLNDIKKSLNEMGFPEGYSVGYAGMAERMEDMMALVDAFFMAIILTYMLLAALLESWIHPLTIMGTLPLAIIGVIFALFITDATISLFSLMAVVMLVGIVVNNGILIIEYTREAELRGTLRKEALIEACRERFRAIIMTAIATVLAMVPLALGMGAGGEMRAPMAIVSIGGLIVSTIMSFFVIPAAYEIVESTRDKIKLWRT